MCDVSHVSPCTQITRLSNITFRVYAFHEGARERERRADGRWQGKCTTCAASCVSETTRAHLLHMRAPRNASAAVRILTRAHSPHSEVRSIIRQCPVCSLSFVRKADFSRSCRSTLSIRPIPRANSLSQSGQPSHTTEPRILVCYQRQSVITLKMPRFADSRAQCPS